MTQAQALVCFLKKPVLCGAEAWPSHEVTGTQAAVPGLLSWRTAVITPRGHRARRSCERPVTQQDVWCNNKTLNVV